MKIVVDRDTETFTDPDGDTLTLLAFVRQRDVERAEDLAQKEALSALKDLGLSMEDAMRQARESSPEDRATARARISAQELSPALRRLRLEAVARRLCVGGQEYGGQAILEAYESMTPASARWVDEQVAAVWTRATPDDAARERPAARLGLPDEPQWTA